MKKINIVLISALFSANVFAVDVETEPNDAMQDANSITPDVMLNGYLSDQEDSDWYTFETSQSNTVKFTISMPDDKYGRRVVQVLDANKNVIYSEIISFNGASSEVDFTSRSVSLHGAGKFFVVVSVPVGRTLRPFDYGLTVSLAKTFLPKSKENPSFSNGILTIPSLDVEGVFGGSSEYEARLKLIPSDSGKLTFEVIDATAK